MAKPLRYFRKGEKEMNKIKFIAISAFSLLVLALPGVVSAQWDDNNRNRDYNQNRRYRGNLENVADRLKDRSRDFERAVDRESDHYRGGNNRGGILGTIINGGRNGNNGYRNGYLERLAEDFRRATNEFENRVDGNDRDDYRRGQEAANRMLSIGSQIDREMYRMRGSRSAALWNSIRNDLNVVANAYGNRGRGGRYPF